MKYAILVGVMALCWPSEPLHAQDTSDGQAAAGDSTVGAGGLLSLSPVTDPSGLLTVWPTIIETGFVASAGAAWSLSPHAVPLVTDEEGRFSLSRMGAGVVVAEEGEGFALRRAADGSTLAWLESTDDGRLMMPRSSVVWFTPNVASQRAQVGVNMSEVDEALATQLGLDRERAALIVGVIEGSPAAKAGVRMYDVVTAVDGMTDASVERIKSSIRAKSEGETVVLTLVRGGRPLTVDVGVRMVDEDGAWALAPSDQLAGAWTDSFLWDISEELTWIVPAAASASSGAVPLKWETLSSPATEEGGAPDSSGSDAVLKRLDRMEAMLAELLERSGK